MLFRSVRGIQLLFGRARLFQSHSGFTVMSCNFSGFRYARLNPSFTPANIGDKDTFVMKNCYDFLFSKSVYVDKTLYLQGFGEIGGGGGIRTPVTSEGKHDFESCAFNRALPPLHRVVFRRI